MSKPPRRHAAATPAQQRVAVRAYRDLERLATALYRRLRRTNLLTPRGRVDLGTIRAFRRVTALLLSYLPPTPPPPIDLSPVLGYGPLSVLTDEQLAALRALVRHHPDLCGEPVSQIDRRLQAETTWRSITKTATVRAPEEHK